MQPLKINIIGNFYDSFIYNGNLLLWDINGDIICLNWDELLHEKFSSSKDTFAYTCAFLQGDYLYGDRWKLFFNDPEIKRLVEKRFSSLSDNPIEITLSDSKNTKFIQKYNNPFPFPHSDCLIYRNSSSPKPNFYLSNTKGIFISPYYKRPNHIFNKSKNLKQISDIPCFNLSANVSTIAMSCGDEGVYKVDTHNITEINNISKEHSSWINWAFSDVYSSSYYTSGFLIESEIEEEQNIYDWQTEKQPLKFLGKESNIGEVFNSNGLSWGVNDKICMIDNGILKIFRYNRHWKKKDKEKFEYLTTIKDKVLDLKGIIKADSAPWGYILEYKSKLIILKSNNQLESISHRDQEITNWRIFPRSVRYANQLHVIFDKHISIYSFNEDYFENQWEKTIGTRFLPNKNRI